MSLTARIARLSDRGFNAFSRQRAERGTSPRFVRTSWVRLERRGTGPRVGMPDFSQGTTRIRN